MGGVLYESGLGCNRCGVCDALCVNRPKFHKFDTGIIYEKGCFGDKSISSCPRGLYYFSVPISGCDGGIANIAAGPFLMTDIDDFLEHDLKRKRLLNTSKLGLAERCLSEIPSIAPGKVNALSNLLSLMSGVIRNTFADTDSGGAKIYEGPAQELSAGDVDADGNRDAVGFPDYPIKTEKKLLASILGSDKPKAQKHINELFGYILFCSGGNIDLMKSETYELLVLISRGAIDVGVPAGKVFSINRRFWLEAQAIGNIDELCVSLSLVMNEYIDRIFTFSHKKNLDDINKAVQYIWQNYSNKITLEEVAGTVFLSPSYFCRVFQKTVGCNFNMYVNRIRIEKSKQLLLRYDLRIADIVSMVGFEDQSYFTKVFKRIAGVSPTHFRKAIEECVRVARYANAV
jgi:AraC-like DNA-binding protein